MSDNPNLSEPDGSSILSSVIVGVVFILLFAIILYIAYIPNRPEEVDKAYGEAIKTQRLEIDGEALNQISTYGWVDQANGVVHIPVERAQELLISEYNKESK